MLSYIFWNIGVPIAIVGVPLFWLVSWIWAFWKIDGLVHKAFEPPPRVLTPEEQAAVLDRALKMHAKFAAARQAEAHHH